ncbi:probable auxin efflux carrier component 8 isoform X2 [Cynara cardunculus var. scolymus]|uniref:probable auxin efflux carrier component 8 isoform X2 n=1 Tax=Cynara cardunculus var. scolymus TaxID=59895 RepID=UPI000D625506|nr:probable auxin efflux carrier component 8 isoform X2 [Cynara cardunculus var. scolymus]
MISLNDAYHILAATIPLYVAMILAYISVKWLKLFNPDQCSGINKFVAKFSIPLLSFQVISKSNPYKMNLKLIYADVLQKVIVLVGAAIITKVRSNGHLNWIITGFSLSTLPNTLILGIPLLKSMYGDEADVLLAQIIALQSLIWYNLLLFLFELSNARDAHMIQLSAATGDSEARQEAQGIDKREETNSRTLRRTKIMLLLLTVGKKLLMNPNSYATIAGLAWASISFRCNIKLPKVVENSISILSDGGLGMAMFSLGLFMASQANIVACGKRLALLAMVLKFIVGPVMVVPSIVFGLKGVPFKIAVIQVLPCFYYYCYYTNNININRLINYYLVQAALPQGIVPFVFANEYNVHPDILSTGY